MGTRTKASGENNPDIGSTEAEAWIEPGVEVSGSEALLQESADRLQEPISSFAPISQAEAESTCVALQQKPQTALERYEPHKQPSNHELHNATLDARDEAYRRCVDTEQHLSQVL